MKKTWYPVLLAAVLAVLAGVVCFRDALLVRLFPRVMLTKAVAATFEELDARFEESPIHILAKGLDPDLRQDVTMKLDTGTKFAGIVHYNLALHTQTAPNRISGSGTVTYGGGTMDLQLYADERFAALASGSLTEGDAYGITYDTFTEDIRSHSLLRMLIGEDVLKDWDASVSGFADRMRGSYTLPEWTAEDIRTALTGALALKPQVSKGAEKNRYTITFRSGGEEIARAVEKYRDQIPENLLPAVDVLTGDGQIEVVFFLLKDQLTAINCSVALGADTYRIETTLGSTLTIRLCVEGPERAEETIVAVQTDSDEETYREVIHFSRTGNGTASAWTADYSRDLSTGEISMNLTRDGKQYPVRLNLRAEGEGFTLHCQEFEQILSLISGKEHAGAALCTLTVAPGEGVGDCPEYRNLADWSVEDFFLLLTRLGTLVGLKLP